MFNAHILNSQIPKCPVENYSNGHTHTYHTRGAVLQHAFSTVCVLEKDLLVLYFLLWHVQDDLTGIKVNQHLQSN